MEEETPSSVLPQKNGAAAEWAIHGGPSLSTSVFPAQVTP